MLWQKLIRGLYRYVLILEVYRNRIGCIESLLRKEMNE